MEYKILQVPQNATTSDAHKAYLEILKKCHPDKLVDKSQSEKDKARRLVELAKEAYDTIVANNKARKSVLDNQPLRPFFMNFETEVDDIFNRLNPIDMFHKQLEDMKNLQASFQTNQTNRTTQLDQKNRNNVANNKTYTSSYSYSNVNGDVKEEAFVNGKKLSEKELQDYKSKNKIKSQLKLR